MTKTYRTYYAAGWSLPGCLPEMEPAIFETEGAAWEFVNEERDREANDPDREPGEVDPYVYWVDQIEPETPYEAYRLACECENLNAHDPQMWAVHGCPEGPI